ncbi:unnamed protein product [Lactuca saligna]|uniref:Uncharacterized protein n=1 Tax=Lactuca saligna TaxID=75948 RepID=A0AA36DYK7_LACSI|nr:unnamed protein product [Lactuca saligna]
MCKKKTTIGEWRLSFEKEKLEEKKRSIEEKQRAREEKQKIRDIEFLRKPYDHLIGDELDMVLRARADIMKKILQDKDLVVVDESIVVNNKPKKKRHSGRSKKEKSIYFCFIPSLRGNDEDYGYTFDQIRFLINELITWNDVAKSILWFGFVHSVSFLHISQQTLTLGKSNTFTPFEFYKLQHHSKI